MRVIIAGSRTITDMDLLESAIIESGFDISEVVCGGARGVDELGKQWAKKSRLPYKLFPAKWQLHGKQAGFIRNTEMSKYAEALIALWDGSSKGTKHMIRIAYQNIEVYVKYV
jgi:hypothetical protein